MYKRQVHDIAPDIGNFKAEISRLLVLNVQATRTRRAIISWIVLFTVVNAENQIICTCILYVYLKLNCVSLFLEALDVYKRQVLPHPHRLGFR